MAKRVLVGVSGGVDSAMSVYLLKEQGYDVVGIYMKMHEGVNHVENVAKLNRLSKKLGFEYVIEDVEDEFRKEVYEYFVESYKQGITPNPCAMCNIKIKFGIFMGFLEKYGCELAATGHYVRNDGEFLYQAKDQSKDQSYFLFGIKKKVLPKILFPLGEYTKDEIKKLASEIGLDEFASQKESQDICFIDNSYIDVLKLHFNPERKGKVVNKRGQKIGVHKGYSFYTVGQRKGFNLFKSHKPQYVIGIDAKSNTLIVGDKKDLEKKQVFLKGVNLFIDDKVFECEAKIRYRAPKVPAVVKMESKSKAVVNFHEPVSGVAKGQACVFYEGEKLLGGGWIRGGR
ncbi:tRNA (5-methylaminomethyl-2-thiouridylate)-methyltransferase [Nautilia profundicola AmH]|uniref:tRNA-specific 2-thiouridylase MnmA n=1 Tax=Nautilia profundicola (strain ATCC BAA-1463 / DSM 18972 / AmH) TaxID=598659 RepID=B9L801_NAUPA|nr:tRNA 2-thiouridine(34) synthase MnmA [Nautilia profundicola]ACM93611.1 tRNA (5-methylaminomethyl-2-thiouridylate)-methyltransferase [Nautilia profundicola AmH]